MKNENYITVQGWMVNELQLTSSELIIYAIIYGFSQDGKTKYKGSMQYLADSAGISRRATLPILKKLVEKNYIKKEEMGKIGNKKCDYYANLDILKNMSCEETSQVKGQPVKKHPMSGEETSYETGEETSHHIDLNKDIFINKNSPTACAVDQKEIIPVFQNPEQNKIAPVSQPPPETKKKRGLVLTDDQKPLFHAAKACFESSEKAKAIMYQERGSTQMHMENLKLFVVRCQNMAPEITADFMRNVLEHFKTIINGKLKGRAEFTPRALITPWIWEMVIGTLPKADNEQAERIRESIKEIWKK